MADPLMTLTVYMSARNGFTSTYAVQFLHYNEGRVVGRGLWVYS